MGKLIFVFILLCNTFLFAKNELLSTRLVDDNEVFKTEIYYDPIEKEDSVFVIYFQDGRIKTIYL